MIYSFHDLLEAQKKLYGMVKDITKGRAICFTKKPFMKYDIGKVKRLYLYYSDMNSHSTGSVHIDYLIRK